MRDIGVPIVKLQTVIQLKLNDKFKIQRKCEAFMSPKLKACDTYLTFVTSYILYI